MNPMHSLAPNLLESLAKRTASVHMWHGRGDLTTWSADDLRQRAGQWALTLQANGIAPGSLVAACGQTSLQLIAAVLGAWLVGAAVVILPERSPGTESSLRRTAEGLQALQPALLLVDAAQGADAMGDGRPVLRLDAATAAAASGLPTPFAAGAADTLALMQLTSGTTGKAKAVPITHRMLAENCLATARRIAVRRDDHMLSWLPLTHDMGFCGAFCQALSTDIALTLLTTARFAQSPLCLLQALSDQRATLSPNPPSAYGLLARLGRRAQREGLDLSRWRFAWVGAEPVFANVLRDFEAAMQPLGLRADVLQPSYGMAEAVVAVSFAPAGRRWQTLQVQARALRETGVVLPLAERPGSPTQEAEVQALTLVSNGPPLDGVEVRVCDEQGAPLPSGREGTLWVRGRSVAGGYAQGHDPQRFSLGWYNTGDLGFLWQGEVYVSGRVKDVVSRGGVKVGAHEIEAAVEAELDWRPGRVAAFASLDHAQGRERVVVLVARRFGTQEPVLERRLEQAVLQHCGMRVDEFVFCAAGPLPRTTSGKLQRGAVRAGWQRGEYQTPCPHREDNEQLV
jgi:fatty-acyl-CoA synthase